MSRTLWGIPINSDHAWSPAGHEINKSMVEVYKCDYKTYWTSLFTSFRYLRYRYISTTNLAPTTRLRLRLTAWFNLITRYESKERNLQHRHNVCSYSPLPKISARFLRNYAEVIVHDLVGDAYFLLGEKRFSHWLTKEKLAEFKDELERDFGLMLMGRAPGVGPVVGKGVEGRLVLRLGRRRTDEGEGSRVGGGDTDAGVDVDVDTEYSALTTSTILTSPSTILDISSLNLNSPTQTRPQQQQQQTLLTSSPKPEIISPRMRAEYARQELQAQQELTAAMEGVEFGRDDIEDCEGLIGRLGLEDIEETGEGALEWYR